MDFSWFCLFNHSIQRKGNHASLSTFIKQVMGLLNSEKRNIQPENNEERGRKK